MPDEVQGIIALTKTQVAQSLNRKSTLAELLTAEAEILAGAETIN